MSTSTNARKAQVVAARALRAAADRLAPTSGKVEFSLRHPRAHAVYEKRGWTRQGFRFEKSGG